MSGLQEVLGTIVALNDVTESVDELNKSLDDAEKAWVELPGKVGNYSFSLKILSQWLYRTQTGMDMLSRSGAYMGQIFNDFWLGMNEVIKDPKGALNALGQSLLNRITGQWDMIKGGFLSVQGKKEEAEKLLSQGRNKILWGDPDIGDKIRMFHNRGKEAVSLNDQESQLSKKQEEWARKKLELQRLAIQYEKNSHIVSDISNQIAREEYELARENFDLVQAKNKLKGGNLSEEDRAKEINALQQMVEKESTLMQLKKVQAQNPEKENRASISTTINLQQELEKEQKIQERIQSEILAMYRKTELERIQLRKDGIEKELALLNHKYQIEKGELDEMAKRWENEQGKPLTDTQKKELESRRQAIDERHTADTDNLYSKDVQKEHEAMMGYLKEYGDYNEKIAAIREAYQAKIDNAGTLGEKQSLQKQMQKELAGVESEMIKSSNAWKTISGSLAGFSTKMVKTYLEEAKASLANSSELTEEETKKLKETIVNTEQKIRQRNPFKAMHESFLLYREALKKGNTEDAAKHFTAFQESAEAARAVIKDITSTASGVGGLVSKDLANVVTQIGGVFEGVVGMMKGLGSNEIGDKIKGVSGIIAAITTIVGDFVDALGESGRAAREYEEFRLEFLNQYYLNLMSIKDEDYTTIFGIETLSRSIDAFGKLTDVSAKYQESLKNVNDASKHNQVSGDLWGKETHKQNKMRNDALTKGYDEVQSMTIMTSESNMWQKLVGKGSRYTTLKDLAPEMWDENGKFNVEAAKIFLDTNKSINKSNNAAQKATIENLIELEGKYEELMTIIREDLKDTFGYLGGAITDEIVNALKNGENAWEDFKDVGVQALETLGKKLMYELFFAKKFQQLQKDMEKVYENETDPEVIATKQAELMDGFFNGLGKDMENAQNWSAEWQKKMAEKGYNIWGAEPGAAAGATETRSATSQGIASMSQDSASELNGNFYALFMTVDGIYQILSKKQEQEINKEYTTLPTLQEMLTVSKSSNTYLLDIRNNTSRLITMDSNIEYMNNNLLAIRNEGVKIRS